MLMNLRSLRVKKLDVQPVKKIIRIKNLQLLN